jgi:hypothetical protein
MGMASSPEAGLERLEDALRGVMLRFREYFVGPGVNMAEEQVPLRDRDDFQAPLVTVLGHTYGIRLTREPRLAVEVSANVYADEFDLQETQRRLAEIYQAGRFEDVVANFLSPEDESNLGRSQPAVFESFFSIDVERDLSLVEKAKSSASKVTGRYVDLILTMKYWIEPTKLPRLTRSPKLFASAVYLYCLRVFMAACRSSLLGVQGGR